MTGLREWSLLTQAFLGVHGVMQVSVTPDLGGRGVIQVSVTLDLREGSGSPPPLGVLCP